jgi:hypothetical protein
MTESVIKITNQNLRLNKTNKRVLANFRDAQERSAWKKMLISAQVAETEARQNPTKLTCSDGSKMWAGA